MSLTYKKATADDIDLLVKTRIEVLRAANNLPDDTDMREVEKESYLYYIKAIPEETHTAFLVFDDRPHDQPDQQIHQKHNRCNHAHHADQLRY